MCAGLPRGCCCGCAALDLLNPPPPPSPAPPTIFRYAVWILLDLLSRSCVIFAFLGCFQVASAGDYSLPPAHSELMDPTTHTLYVQLCSFVLLDCLQAVPFVEIIEVLALWFCISVPMVFLGAYFGYRKPVEPYPVVTSNIPRQVRLSRPVRRQHRRML